MQPSCNMLQTGVSHRSACEIKYQAGVLHHFEGVLTSLKKYLTIWRIAAIVSHIARDMGPLSR